MPSWTCAPANDGSGRYQALCDGVWGKTASFRALYATASGCTDAVSHGLTNDVCPQVAWRDCTAPGEPLDPAHADGAVRVDVFAPDVVVGTLNNSVVLDPRRRHRIDGRGCVLDRDSGRGPTASTQRLLLLDPRSGPVSPGAPTFIKNITFIGGAPLVPTHPHQGGAGLFYADDDHGLAVPDGNTRELRLESLTFSGIRAGMRGGAVVIDGEGHLAATLLGCRFQSNHATDGGVRDGDALWNTNGRVQATGGAVDIFGRLSSVRMQVCVFEDNVAGSTAMPEREVYTSGGAVHFNEGSPTRRTDEPLGNITDQNIALIIDCRFERNQAARGGAVAAVNWRQFVVSGTAFVANTATTDVFGAARTAESSWGYRFETSGGAIGAYVEGADPGKVGATHTWGKGPTAVTLRVAACSFQQNEARCRQWCHGGAIFTSRDHGQHTEMSFAVFTQNRVLASADGVSTMGGAFCYMRPSDGSVFNGHDAYKGLIDVISSTFEGNVASQAGAGVAALNTIWLKLDTTTFRGTPLLANAAEHACFNRTCVNAYRGGAVFSYYGRLSVLTSTFLAHTVGGEGGAIAEWFSQEDTTIHSCRFERNTAAPPAPCHAVGTGTYFCVNGADGGQGGALYMMSGLRDSLLQVSSCRFERNAATHSAGAVLLNDWSAQFNACLFVHNHADGRGGVFRLEGASTILALATNCRVISNTAGVAEGVCDTHHQGARLAAAPSVTVVCNAPADTTHVWAPARVSPCPSPAPTHSPTPAPTEAPTSPTPAPTEAPTPHPCRDGSHECDAPERGGICYGASGGRWRCGCYPAFYCSAGCRRPYVNHTCTPRTLGPTSAPTLGPSAAPSTSPTTAPTTAPTLGPTASPSRSPTAAPTPHPCEDGSHGCDAAPGGVCYATSSALTWRCDCAPAFVCTAGCTMPHINHTCAAITPAPTSSPTTSPTRAPTGEACSAGHDHGCPAPFTECVRRKARYVAAADAADVFVFQCRLLPGYSCTAACDFSALLFPPLVFLPQRGCACVSDTEGGAAAAPASSRTMVTWEGAGLVAGLVAVGAFLLLAAVVVCMRRRRALAKKLRMEAAGHSHMPRRTAVGSISAMGKRALELVAFSPRKRTSTPLAAEMAGGLCQEDRQQDLERADARGLGNEEASGQSTQNSSKSPATGPETGLSMRDLTLVPPPLPSHAQSSGRDAMRTRRVRLGVSPPSRLDVRFDGDAHDESIVERPANLPVALSTAASATERRLRRPPTSPRATDAGGQHGDSH